MIKSHLLTDPTTILKNHTEKVIEEYATNVDIQKGLTEVQRVLVTLLKDNTIIHWDITDEGGYYDVGITWWGHGHFSDPDKAISLPLFPKSYYNCNRHSLKQGEVKFLLTILAKGCEVNPTVFEKTYDDEVSLTTIHNPHSNEHGKLYAGFLVEGE